MKDLYSESYRHQWKKRKTTQTDGKYTTFRDWGTDTVKTSPAKQSPFQCDPYWNAEGMFHRNKTSLNFLFKHRRPWIPKTILRKKNRAGGITLPDCRRCYKATGVKTAWSWHKSWHTHRSMEQNSEPRNSHTRLWPINPQQRRKEYTMEKRISSAGLR